MLPQRASCTRNSKNDDAFQQQRIIIIFQKLEFNFIGLSAFTHNKLQTSISGILKLRLAGLVGVCVRVQAVEGGNGWGSPWFP
jgi:hypothetical protein